MLFVPLGYKNKSLGSLDEIHGGSPYGKTLLVSCKRLLFNIAMISGAGTLAGSQGERQPSPLELQLAETQGHEFAKIVQKLTPRSR